MWWIFRDFTDLSALDLCCSKYDGSNNNDSSGIIIEICKIKFNDYCSDSTDIHYYW